MRRIFYTVLICIAAIATSSCNFSPDVMSNREGGVTGQIGKCTKMEDSIKITDAEKIMIDLSEDYPGKGKMGVVSWIIYIIRVQLDVITQGIYESFGESDGWKFTIGAATTMVILFYFIMITTGAAPANALAMFITVFKILFVWSFATEWDYFSRFFVQFFEVNLVQGLTLGVSSLFSGGVIPFGNDVTSAIAPELPNAGQEQFSVADELISLVYNFQFLKISLASAFSGPAGMMYSGIIIVIFIGYISILARAIFIYLMALVARHLLYIVAPLFIPFILFAQTRSLFDNWMRMLIDYTLKPVLMFAFLGLFHGLMWGIINSSVLKDKDQEICYRELYCSQGGTYCFYFWQFGKSDVESPGIGEIVELLPLLSAMLLMFMMFQLVAFSQQVAAGIAGGFSSQKPSESLFAAEAMGNRVKGTAAGVASDASAGGIGSNQARSGSATIERSAYSEARRDNRTRDEVVSEMRQSNHSQRDIDLELDKLGLK